MTSELRDITTIFDHYRVAARSVWNTAFWPDPDLHRWDFVDEFDSIRRILFDSLVLWRIDEEFPTEHMFRKPAPFLHVVPSPGRSPIMIQNPRGPLQSGYWDDPVREIESEGSEMHLIDFFDWDRMAVVDFRYYRVSIVRFDQNSHLIGREALIETQYARIVYSPVLQS